MPPGQGQQPYHEAAEEDVGGRVARAEASPGPAEDSERLERNVERVLRVTMRGVRGRDLEAERILVEMGQEGADAVADTVREGHMWPQSAAAVLDLFEAPMAAAAAGKMMEENAVGSASQYALEYLKRRDLPASIPRIARWAGRRLQAAHEAVADNDQAALFDLDVAEALADVRQAIATLQDFTHEEGVRQAQELHREHEALVRGIEADKAELIRNGDRIHPFSGPEPMAFSALSEDQERSVLESLDHVTEGRYGGETTREVSAVEEAASFIENYGSASGMDLGVLYSTIESVAPEAAARLYRNLLIRELPEGIHPLRRRAVFDRLMRRPEFLKDAAKDVAEYARQLGDLKALYEREGDYESQDEVAAEFNRALAVLDDIDDPRSRNYRSLLRYAHPEGWASSWYGGEPEEERMIDVTGAERPEKREYRKWSHARMYIRGSALYAELLGRGKEKVRDIDVFLVHAVRTTADDRGLLVENFDDLNDLEALMPPAEFAKLKTWIESRGYAGKKINLVRMPQTHLTREETFQDEPKLILWDKDAEDFRALEGGDDDQDDDYRQGKRLINPKFPERLTPNGTLARALRVADLGERFGLEYDGTMLEQAEHAAQNGTLVISAHPFGKIGAHHELSGSSSLDPVFMKVFEDKKLKKLLIKRCTRLTQIAEAVSKAGGPEAYIRQNYGQAYLDIRGFVRLYDINLTKSPVDIEAQKRFIGLWYSELNAKEFVLSGVSGKTSEDPELPRPENLEDLVDKTAMDNAVERRKEKRSMLDMLVGRYRLSLDCNDPATLRRKIDTFLEVMGLEWPSGAQKDKQRVTKTLIKLGVHPKNPILSQFDSSKSHEVELVISNQAFDILQASTGKPWTSCTNLEEGSYQRGLYDDIAAASVIAYIVKGEQFAARKIVRAGMTLETFEPAAAVEKTYGDGRYGKAMLEAIQTLLRNAGLKVNQPMMTYPFSPNTYFDSASGQTAAGNHFYHTHGEYGGRGNDYDIDPV
jgi:hypothetical protein